MSFELIVIIVIISTVAGTISAGIRYYGKKGQGKKEKSDKGIK